MARTARNNKVDTRTARLKLKPRKEPYWTPISKGKALGYYRGTKGSGTWIAKFIGDDGRRVLHKIGPADDYVEADDISAFDHAQAQERARQWFTESAHPQIVGEPALTTRTVGDALEGYLRFLREEKAESTAYDVETRFRRYVEPVFGDVALKDLTAQKILTWRSSLLPKDDVSDERMRRAKYNINSHLKWLKAALNRAFMLGLVDSDLAWRRVAPYRSTDAARKVFLRRDQLQRLVNCCEGAFRDFVQAAIHTGCRYGELTTALVGGFHLELGTLHVNGKTGPRDIYLSDSAVAFFKGLTVGRDPDGLLLSKDDNSQWGKNHHIRLMARAVKRAGLPEDTVFYSLRHSYASISLLGGVNHQILAENMGTSIKMLERHYGKFMAADRRNQFNAAAPTLATEISPNNVVSIRGA